MKKKKIVQLVFCCVAFALALTLIIGGLIVYATIR